MAIKHRLPKMLPNRSVKQVLKIFRVVLLTQLQYQLEVNFCEFVISTSQRKIRGVGDTQNPLKTRQPSATTKIFTKMCGTNQFLPFSITSGVAQGCTLSTLFFLVHLNDLLKELQDVGIGCRPQNFTDIHFQKSVHPSPSHPNLRRA
jgi:hypothetical protein